MIRKRNSLKKAMETLKRGVKPEPEFIFKELEQASEELTEVIELMKNPKWIMMHSLLE